jgi:crotonobetainyl-CoA:carnitine CoA-transferase CaiB-like acyl-CoA transferase
VTTTGPAARLSRTPLAPGRPAPKPGSDAREVLAEFGLDDRYDALVESGVLVTEGVAPR